MHTTEAWVLRSGEQSWTGDRDLATTVSRAIQLESFSFAPISPDEVLVEPLYGSWEGNMSHALMRNPVDICRLRGEETVVIGNSGVVRIIEVGMNVVHLVPNQVCLFFGTGKYDRFGYMELAHGFDAPRTIGLLAKRTKVPGRNLFPIPEGSRYSYSQWAAFSLRYLTAWSNWRVALGALRLQLSEVDLPTPYVWGWGGGTTLAELSLAKLFKASVTMVVGNEKRAAEAEEMGVSTIDRRSFPDLGFDEDLAARDSEFRRNYMRSERKFLAAVKNRTGGLGVSIFVDYIGTPMLRPTLRALGRQGVLTTAGWKFGMETDITRANECIRRHIHVHTHYARHEEVLPAMTFGESEGWMPTVPTVYGWSEVPRLAAEHAAGLTSSHFPLYEVNAP